MHDASSWEEAEVTEVEPVESPSSQAAPAEPIPGEVQPVELADADALPAEAAPGEPIEAPPATSKEELPTTIEDNPIDIDQAAESSEHTGVSGNAHTVLSLDNALDDAE